MNRSWIWMVSFLLLFFIPGPMGECATKEATLEGEGYIEVPFILKRPHLDGYIDDLEWPVGPANVRYFDAFDGRSFQEIYPLEGSDEEFTDERDIAVTFFLFYDEEYLYFVANVTDQSIVIDSGTSFWRDDGIELLIDGAHDLDWDQRAPDPWPGFQDGTTFLTLADGSVFYDYSNLTPYERHLGADKDWFAVVRTDDANHFYVVEMRVRLDAIASPQPSGTIGLNVGVNDDDTGGLSKTALKWVGREAGPGENPTFKNESHWGTALLKSYIRAELPGTLEVDEDSEVTILSNTSFGNHPDFLTGSNHTWTLRWSKDGEWNELVRYGPSFVHTFGDPGSYDILLNITDPSGTFDTANMTVHVRDVTPPTLVFSDAVALEEVPFVYSFEAVDNVGVFRVDWVISYNWRGCVFNTSTTLPVLTHTYEHPGHYSISFTVLDAANNSAAGNATILVEDAIPPVIEGTIRDIVTYTSMMFVLTAPYAFDDTESGPDKDLIYNWTLTGELKSYNRIVRYDNMTQFVVQIPGEYKATLSVTDVVGLSSSLHFNVTMLDDNPPEPVFSLPNEIGQNEVMELNASGCTDNDPMFWDDPEFKWTVRLKDGSFSEVLYGTKVRTSIPNVGTAVVTLSVLDPSGNEANITKEVNVFDTELPKLVFGLKKGTVDQYERFLLDITGSSDNLKIVSVHLRIFSIKDGNETLWFATPVDGIDISFVDETKYSAIQELWISIRDPGRFRIELTLRDVSGLNASASALLNVRDSIPPEAILNRTSARIFEGQRLFLSGAESIDATGPLTYEWLLDNVTMIGSGPEVKWTFNETGGYQIVLKVTDTGGNTDRAVCNVTVVKAPKEEPDLTWLWVASSAILVLLVLFILIVVSVFFIIREKKKEEKRKKALIPPSVVMRPSDRPGAPPVLVVKAPDWITARAPMAPTRAPEAPAKEVQAPSPEQTVAGSGPGAPSQAPLMSAPVPPVTTVLSISPTPGPPEAPVLKSE